MPVRPGPRRAAAQRGRKLGVICGALLIPVIALAALYLTAGGGFQRLGLNQAGASQRQASAPRTSPATGDAPVPAASTAIAVGTPGVSRAGAAQAITPARRSPRPRATMSASPSPGQAQSPPAGSPPPSQQSEAASQVLALINQARSQAGLPAYTITAGLDRSSAAHNALMASGCGLSHQCPGEPPLGTRETDAGVTWTSAGENIGEGGPVSDTSAAIAQMAVGLTQDMLNEKPPDDGHRLNILSSSFTHIGITVSIDSSGTVWMTQDFSN